MGVDHGHGVLFAGHDGVSSLCLELLSLVRLWFPPTATSPIRRFSLFLFVFPTSQLVDLDSTRFDSTRLQEDLLASQLTKDEVISGYRP